MAEQLEEIKRKIDIVQFINNYVPLKKTGRNFKALCPFHSETVPSFIVSPERQIWHCFGQCGEGGDIFKFLMKIENIDFGEALRELAKRAGVKLVSYRLSEDEKQKQLLYEINHLAAEFYHYLLLNHPAGKRALNYILGRGINKDSLEKFKLGYSPNMWEGLQRFLVGKKGYRVEDLERAGLVIRRDTPSVTSNTKENVSRTNVLRVTWYDRFRDRLIFPLKDHRGDICGFAGRKIPRGFGGSRPKGDEGEAKYINSPETLIYHKSDLLYGLFENKDEIKKVDGVILVEGELDAISSYQVGVKNMVAIKGSALTPRQVQLLSRFTKNITFALDSDIAGDAAVRRGIEVADGAGVAMGVVEIKGGKDPDEVAQKNPQLWQRLVSQAVPVYDYFLNSAFSKFDPELAEGKRKIGQELIPILAKISDKIVQAHYIQALAERLGIEEEAIAAEIAKFEVSLATTPAQVREEIIQKDRREILEEHLLVLCFQSENWAWLRKRKPLSLVKTPRFLRILESLGDYLKKYKTLDSERLTKMLAPELKESFNQLYLFDLGNLAKDEDKLKSEFQETIRQLEKFSLKEKLKQIAEEIENLEKEKSSSSKLDKLNEEFRDLGARLAELEEKE